jgi:hypothetical protein
VVTDARARVKNLRRSPGKASVRRVDRRYVEETR